MNDEEELDLIKKFKVKESRNYAFNLLVRKYQQKLYWHIRRMVIVHEDADDILQNVFIKVWKNLDGFNRESSLYTWLYRIATNECLTFLKKKRTRFFIPVMDIEVELLSKLKDDSQFSGEEIVLKLQKALLCLPEKQRLVFNMKYYDELTYEEISEIVGTSVGALKASYHQAIKKIEKKLNEG